MFHSSAFPGWQDATLSAPPSLVVRWPNASITKGPVNILSKWPVLKSNAIVDS